MLVLATVGPLSLAAAQTQTGAPALPPTGVDYSGIDEFYKVAAILSTDAEPTDAQWNALLSTPGYRFVAQQFRNEKAQLQLALKPSKKAARDSVLSRQSDQALALRHLMRAVEQRDAVLATRAALQASIADSIQLAVRAAAHFLPKGAVETRPVPFIAFAVFGDDGYAVDGGVLLDPLFVKEEGLVPLISHEFHHAFTAGLERSIRPGVGAPPYDVALASSLRALRNEGIADQIDKPHPLPPTNGALAWYVPRYNDVYARTPAILHAVDSLLAVVRDDSTKAQAAGQQARTLLWSNSHPNGAYMAREIVETFGVDSLMPGIYNFVAFLRAYASAEAKRGNPPPFSAQALEKLNDIERRYIRP
jgi:hypothetical protein